MSDSLWEYVRDGPAAGDSVKGRIVGLYLHWRTWAMCVVFAAGAVVVAHHAPSQHGTTGWIIGLFTAIIASWVVNDE